MKQEKVAKVLLKDLKFAGIDSIVAGGMPRDILLGRKFGTKIYPKDVDIYVRDTGNLPNIEKFATDLKFTCHNNDYIESGMNDIVKVYNGTIHSGIFGRGYTKVQIIIVRTDLALEEYVLNNFDISLCMCIFDGENYKGLEPFCKTMETGEVYFNGSLSLDATKYSIDKHLYKMYKRYSDKFNFPFYNHKYTGKHNVANLNPLLEIMSNKADWIFKNENYQIGRF